MSRRGVYILITVLLVIAALMMWLMFYMVSSGAPMWRGK